MTFNGDTGSNYALRYSTNGAADATSTSTTNIGVVGAAVANPFHAVMFINNIAADEKTVTLLNSQANTAGAGNAPQRLDLTGKWANTANQITTISVANGGTGDYASGSEMIVLGHD